MPRKRSNRFYLIEALRARGYQEVTRDPAADSWRIFSIYHNHPKRIGKPEDRIWVGIGHGGVKVGRHLAIAKPMPMATQRNLAQEGLKHFDPVFTMADLCKALKIKVPRC